MPMIKNPNTKYKAFQPISLPDRTWPNRSVVSAPIWLSTDLRDGNQAIPEPMGQETKLAFFKMLVEEIGFKEIEVGFPSASQIEFDFVRGLIEGGHIPADVTIQVLTQAREHLIARTMESVRGAGQAIIHFYTATSPLFRDVVFGMSKEEVTQMAVQSAQQIQYLATQQDKTKFILEYSPETFSQTEVEFAKEISDAVADVWNPTPDNKMIINLPATVEASMPHHYADRVEWMKRNMRHRDNVILSVHTHNDRGTGVAATELALLAGAERVEGCLLGHGERTGNVDLITLALNLYTQGVDPRLDLSNLPDITRRVTEWTKIPISPRHPYSGDLVFTAFSGSHQDAIKKGLEVVKDGALFQVPYTPLDPREVGRELTDGIRINSQSGKGGVAYILESTKGIVLPRDVQIEFSGIVQKYAERTQKEVSADEVWRLFQNEYLSETGNLHYNSYHSSEVEHHIELTLNGKKYCEVSKATGPVDAMVKGLERLGLPIGILSYEENAITGGADAQAICIVKLSLGDGGKIYGIGVNHNTVVASLQAVVHGVNRALEQKKLTLPPVQKRILGLRGQGNTLKID